MQLVYGNANQSTLVTDTTPEYLTIRNWTISRGRALDREDMVQGSKVVVLGRTVAEKLFGNQNPVGQEIRSNRIPITVIGESTAKRAKPGRARHGRHCCHPDFNRAESSNGAQSGQPSGDLGCHHQGARWC